MKLDPTKFKYGIEHEFPCIKNGAFVDFSTATFESLNEVIDILPVYESDYATLRIGDLGIKKKRWYIEGFERFSKTGEYLYTAIKGFEIRTPVASSIDEAVTTLQDSFSLWKKEAKKYGYISATTAFNPFRTAFIPEPVLNEWEIAARHSPEEQTAFMHMLTYGPDVSFSHPDLTTEQIIAIGKKLTYYSPFIVPFSFSSPFFNNALWEGLSYRTYYRTGKRPACMVFVKHDEELLKTVPTLTEKARLPSEVGRIEFKAFDTIEDVTLYGSLLALVVGIAMDETLPGSASTPDEKMHKQSALRGFADESIYQEALRVFEAAIAVVPLELKEKIEVLRPMLDLRRTPADSMVEEYNSGKSIIEIITHNYE
ncbi:MAG: glutamate--cysteine ligase [Candidatus Paceibacterota bacterium]